MQSRNKLLLATLFSLALVASCSQLLAQQTAKPLTNDGVIAMVKGGVPESVVISTIQSQPSKFDISPNGLIALQKAGITKGEMDAVVAAATGGGTPSAGPALAAVAPVAMPSAVQPAAAPNAAAVSPGAKSRMPRVAVIQGGNSQELPLEKTQLAQTKTKPTSMKNLAGDSAVTQAMQAGISTAAMGAATHMNSGIGGSAVQQAGGIFSGIAARRKPNITYVWGVLNPVSSTVLQADSPAFSVKFANTPGINPEDFEPAIVKLTPAQNTCRIVGATQGKEDASSSAAADWQIYTSFLEERVAVNSQKVKSGEYQISPSSPLLPGEYGLVLRPVSKSKKFSGGDVARSQGDGLMFNSVWSFQISTEAQ
jgi:hypothetical protein